MPKLDGDKSSNVIVKEFKDKDVIDFMRDMAYDAKRRNVRSVLIMTVTEAGHVSWESWVEGDHDAALMTLAMEDAREEMKDMVFGESDEIR